MVCGLEGLPPGVTQQLSRSLGLRGPGTTLFLIHCIKLAARGGLTFKTDRTLVFVNSPVLCRTGVRGRQRSEIGLSGTAVTEPFTVPQGAAAKFLVPPPPSTGNQPKLETPRVPIVLGNGKSKTKSYHTESNRYASSSNSQSFIFFRDQEQIRGECREDEE